MGAAKKRTSSQTIRFLQYLNSTENTNASVFCLEISCALSNHSRHNRKTCPCKLLKQQSAKVCSGCEKGCFLDKCTVATGENVRIAGLGYSLFWRCDRALKLRILRGMNKMVPMLWLRIGVHSVPLGPMPQYFISRINTFPSLQGNTHEHKPANVP